MKSSIIIIFSFVMLSIGAIGQTTQDNDMLMGNIELLNSKITDLSARIGKLKAKLNSVDDKVKLVSQNITKLDSNTRKGFEELEQELQRIDVDYKATLKQIYIFRNENEVQEEKITLINTKLLSLSNDLLEFSQNLTQVHILVMNIPDIYVTPEVFPRFGVNLALVKFVTFGLSDVNVEPVYTIGASYRLGTDLSIWGEFSSPFVLSLSSHSTSNGKISDKWNALLYSIGVERQFKFPNFPDLNFSLSGGVFLANVTYDDYANSTIIADRSQVNGMESFGANIKLGISYNQFRFKNPMELYLHFNNLVSLHNIVLSTDPDPKNKFDLGAYLFSVSVGLKFHFW